MKKLKDGETVAPRREGAYREATTDDKPVKPHAAVEDEGAHNDAAPVDEPQGADPEADG